MNKKALAIGLFLTLASICSCKPVNSSSSQNSQNEPSSSSNSSMSEYTSNSSISSNSSSSSQEIQQKLNAPKLKIDNGTGVVTWDEVEGATHYNYVINDGEIQTTVNRTITLNDQENVSVQASSDSKFSEFSNAVTFYDTSDIEIEALYKVHYHNSNLKSIEVEKNATISRPTNPSKENYTFDDWYKDSFYQEKFDFSQPIESNTIIYANWIPKDLIKDTYYWVKGSSHITSEVSSSSSGWKFIPLEVNEGQTTFKEFCVTVHVNGASETSPAQFIVMDGFSDDAGRSYWKKGTEDFTIKKDGTYNIYFSAEYQYSKDIHILVSEVNNAGLSYLQRYKDHNDRKWKTPHLEIDYEHNRCSWEKDEDAISYEVIVDNGEIKKVTTNNYSVSKRSHISIRSVYSDGTKSNWSIPKANINYVIKEQPSSGECFVYFKDGNTPSIKVNKGEQVQAVTLQDEEHRTFLGWYLEPSLKTKVTFPYTVNESVIFYPKWNYQVTKQYYKLTDSSGNVIDGFTWNYDNYDFLEYELKYKVLDAKDYKIKSLDGQTTYTSFSIGKKGTYSIYFSEENLWEHPDKEGQKRNIYIRHDKTDFYFTNSLSWSNVYAYYWKKSSNDAKYTWPGEVLTKVTTNDMGQDIYKVSIDLVQYDYVIFNDGNGKQTVDISIANISTNAFYANDIKDSNNHYTIGKWNYQN